MATYTHFAKQPDVLKHLILCEVLRNEAPQVYVETNSACAIYSMTQTPEQQYGIYHFLEKADDDKSLKDSIYYQLESTEMAKGNYLGSPALAMNVLGKQAKRFVFFDLEKSALENVDIYAKQIGLSTPGAAPSSAPVTLVVMRFSIFLLSTTEIEPVNDSFLAVPYATTTTSSKASALLLIVTFTLGLIATSCVCIPIYEITRVFAELQHSYFINNQAIIPCNRNHYSEISFLTRCMYRGTMYKTLLL